MLAPIEPLQQADLPERAKAFWKMTGPGAVLVGLSLGAGEMVIWPLITAEYGASMIWAAVLGVFLQMWLNIEIGRWAIATGETPYTGFARMWKVYAYAFILLNIAGWLLPGWARISGSALKALIFSPDHDSPDWLWTAITFAGVAAVLFGPKRIYAAVERTISVLIVLIVIGLLYIAVKIATWETIAEMARGLVNFGHIEPGFPHKSLFIAVVFAGAGGTANLFYAFYLRDKQIGMGARIPVLVNPMRDKQESAIQAGYIFSESDDNKRRFRDWMRFVVQDQVLYFWLLNTFTMLLFIFGALAVLHPQGIVPEQGRLIWDEAMILADSIGPSGRYLFLIIGLATLFSTQVTVVDGLARSLADISSMNFKFGRRISQSGLYLWLVVGIILFGVGLTAFLEYKNISGLGFLFNAAYMGGFAMALYTPLLLWMNLRHLPPSARPGKLNIVMMCIATVVYTGFALYCLGSEVSAWLAPADPAAGG